MRPLPLIVAIGFSGLLLVGCKKSGAARLEGHWKGIKASGVPADVLGSANLFASNMELDFHGDQISVKTADEKQSGRYKVVHEDKKRVVIVTDEDGPKDEQTFTFTDEKTMDWGVMPGKTIQFVKE